MGCDILVTPRATAAASSGKTTKLSTWSGVRMDDPESVVSVIRHPFRA